MSTLNVLAIGDPHLRAKYIRIVDDFIQQTVELVSRRNPDFVVILGDTLHDHERTREPCHTRAVKWFKSLAKHTRVIILIGNHDRPNNSHFLTDSHFFNGLKGTENITIVDDHVASKTVTKGSSIFRLVFVPYVPNGRYQEALDTLDVSIESERPTAIFSHQEFRGVKMGALVSSDGDPWGPDKPLNISGHIHEHQIIGNNIIYPGTPYQTTYSEESNKGVFMFGFRNEGGPSIDRIKLNLRTKMTINLTPQEFQKFELPAGNIDIRIKITGKQESVEAIRNSELYKNLRTKPNVKIVLVPQYEGVVKMTEKKSFMKAFADAVSSDPYLKTLHEELFSKAQ